MCCAAEKKKRTKGQKRGARLSELVNQDRLGSMSTLFAQRFGAMLMFQPKRTASTNQLLAPMQSASSLGAMHKRPSAPQMELEVLHSLKYESPLPAFQLAQMRAERLNKAKLMPLSAAPAAVAAAAVPVAERASSASSQHAPAAPAVGAGMFLSQPSGTQSVITPASLQPPQMSATNAAAAAGLVRVASTPTPLSRPVALAVVQPANSNVAMPYTCAPLPSQATYAPLTVTAPAIRAATSSELPAPPPEQLIFQPPSHAPPQQQQIQQQLQQQVYQQRSMADLLSGLSGVGQAIVPPPPPPPLPPQQAAHVQAYTIDSRQHDNLLLFDQSTVSSPANAATPSSPARSAGPFISAAEAAAGLSLVPGSPQFPSATPEQIGARPPSQVALAVSPQPATLVVPSSQVSGLSISLLSEQQQQQQQQPAHGTRVTSSVQMVTIPRASNRPESDSPRVVQLSGTVAGGVHVAPQLSAGGTLLMAPQPQAQQQQQVIQQQVAMARGLVVGPHLTRGALSQQYHSQQPVSLQPVPIHLTAPMVASSGLSGGTPVAFVRRGTGMQAVTSQQQAAIAAASSRQQQLPPHSGTSTDFLS